MKKSLVSALTTALVVGAASTTFAAANPFSDVPADHWAYDAVAQLAADGVVEGYGDGTYRGDRSITRYEMAQMVAKAMARADVSAADRALIDRLAAEFSEELNNLGVRVAKLEKHADMVKWNGVVEYTYTSTRHQDQAKDNSNELLFRLEPTAEVNKNWDVHARLDAKIQMSGDGPDGVGDNKVELKRVWAEGHYDKFNVKLGKLPNSINLLSTTDDPFSGAAISFGKDVKFTAEAGRVNLNDANLKDALRGMNGQNGLWDDTAANFWAVELGFAPKGSKFSGAIGFEQIGLDGKRAWITSNKAGNLVHGTVDGNDNIWFANAKYAFDKNFSLKGEFAKSNLDGTNFKLDNGLNTGNGGSANNAWSIEAKYKGAKKENKGSWGAYLAYRKLGQLAAPWSTYGDGVDGGQKGWEIGAEYTLFKNVQLFAKYFNGKDLVADQDASKIFGRVDVFF